MPGGLTGGLVVVSRFRPAASAADFEEQARTVVAALSGRPGFVSADLGRNVDEPDLWVLVTRWERVGDWRRALQGYEMKMTCTPFFLQAVDEPSAYELV